MTINANISPESKRLISLAILIAIIITMCSCSASRLLRKAIKKDPSMFQDTVRMEKVDTIIIEVPEVNTSFIQVRDTIIEYIQNTKQGPVRIKYIWNTTTDSVLIEADCPDTEIIEKVITEQLPPIILEPNVWQKIEWMVYLVGVLAVYYLLLKARRR